MFCITTENYKLFVTLHKVQLAGKIFGKQQTEIYVAQSIRNVKKLLHKGRKQVR